MEEKSETILLLSKLQPGSGNNSTMSRICCHFEASCHKCISVDTDSIKSVGDLQQLITNHGVTMALGLHAYHAGKWLKDLKCPNALIFGGTDLNELTKDPDKYTVMTEAITSARILVCFNKHMADKACVTWPYLKEKHKKIQIIPQGVLLSISPHARVCIHTRFHLPPRADIVIMPGAIRPVKDQLFILDAFSEWHKNNQNVYLAIVGSVMDKHYGDTVLNRIKGCQGILFLGIQSLQDTHCLIQHSLALVNSSLSEGQPIAVLEAQSLGIPVIVRGIPGNVAIVQHGVTGLVFNTAQEFSQHLDHLLADRYLKHYITNNARDYVNKTHNYHAEKSSYLRLISNLH